MVKIILFLLQLVFMSFVSSVIQFTFVVPISIHSFIKINADTVGFQKTHVFTKLLFHNFNDPNHVVYQTFAVKCFFRRKIQTAALVYVREVLDILKNS